MATYTPMPKNTFESVRLAAEFLLTNYGAEFCTNLINRCKTDADQAILMDVIRDHERAKDIRTLHVVSLDVWGNEDDGYQVNDAHYTGDTITVDVENDAAIIDALKIDGLYLSSEATTDNVTIEGDPDYMLTIDDAETGYPMYQLHANR